MQKTKIEIIAIKGYRMQYKGKVNPKTLSLEVLAELRQKGICQRGLVRYFMRGKSIIAKRV